MASISHISDAAWLVFERKQPPCRHADSWQPTAANNSQLSFRGLSTHCRVCFMPPIRLGMDTATSAARMVADSNTHDVDDALASASICCCSFTVCCLSLALAIRCYVGNELPATDAKWAVCIVKRHWRHWRHWQKWATALWVAGQWRRARERVKWAQNRKKSEGTIILYICKYKWWRSVAHAGNIINRFHAILAVIFQQTTNTMVCVYQKGKITKTLQKIEKKACILPLAWLVRALGSRMVSNMRGHKLAATRKLW